MTIYKVDNVYYSDESIEQYIDQNYSFADFLADSIKDESGNVRGMLNTMNRVWNSENQNQVVNYLNALNYLYVGYVNNVLSKIPRYSVVEGGASSTGSNPPTSPEQTSVEKVFDSTPDINCPPPSVPASQEVSDDE